MTETTTLAGVLRPFKQGDPSVLISALQAVQEQHGLISEAHMRAVSQHLNVPMSRIYGVATFYSQFRLKPLGRHVINLCRGTACHVKGSEKLIPILEQELGCKAGETTKDGRFTLELVACLGACSLAPAMAIDGDFYGNVTAKAVKKILKKYE